MKKLRPLPFAAVALLRELDAPTRLMAHLRLVHDVAATLEEALQQQWPGLTVDREQVSFGAATHDIGKAIERVEITAPGKRHETVGYELLLEAGIPAHLARFARNHGEQNPAALETIEDIIVALADKVWRGKRPNQLETELAERIAVSLGEDSWLVYAQLDDILTPLAESADKRLSWQNQHSL